MQRWMIAANGKVYDHAAAFAKWGYIDWRQRANYGVGDIVYIYCTKPYSRVMYKAVVEMINLPFHEITDDKEFWSDISEYWKGKTGNYARLKLLETVDRDDLSLESLKRHGLKAAPQGPVRVSSKLAQHLDKAFNNEYEESFFPDTTVIEDAYEGATKKVVVNRYERSSIARNECVKHHGCRCAICGLDFEERYGEIGKGFIHVHHIKPLNTINKEYKVDYINDLIPVCPNCHAMLHRKIDGREITIDELKEIYRIHNTK